MKHLIWLEPNPFNLWPDSDLNLRYPSPSTYLSLSFLSSIIRHPAIHPSIHHPSSSTIHPHPSITIHPLLFPSAAPPPLFMSLLCGPPLTVNLRPKWKTGKWERRTGATWPRAPASAGTCAVWRRPTAASRTRPWAWWEPLTRSGAPASAQRWRRSWGWAERAAAPRSSARQVGVQ